MNPNPITGEDLDDLSDLAPVGDPEDGGIVYTPVDIRDCYNFAEFAEKSYYGTRPRHEAGDNPPLDDTDLVEKLARRYATKVLGWEARELKWTAVPGTSPLQARHDLADTEHRLHYRPNRLSGEYEIVLERWCRLHRTTDFLSVSSLSELGALLAGKDVER
jgi:hypothetical protein